MMDFKFQDDKLESASIRRRRKRQIQLVLRHRAALEVAICKKIAPSAPPAGSYAESLTKYKEALKAFEKVCSACTLAQLILVSSMNDVNVELMATSKSPPEIWHNFVAVKEQTSGQGVDRLMEEFLKCVRKYFEFKTDWESVAVGEPHVNLLIERLRLIEMRLPEKRIDLLVAVIMKTNTKENVKKGQKNVLQMSSDWTCHETLLWLADFGASHHTTCNMECFTYFVTFPQHVNVKVGNGHSCLWPVHCKLQAMQDECFPNLADGYQSNCYKSGCLIQARGDGSFCHHKTEDEFLAVMKVRKEAKCETQTNVFQIWLMDTNQIVTSRDVLFKPEEMDLSVIITVMKVRKEAKCETEEAVLGSKRVGKIPNYLSDYFLTAHTSTPSSFRAGTNEIPTKAMPNIRL
ncbi:hypothetical protein T05_15651 [Trichinella murrelli]|uniref:Uncharacterized protein n=1 Tax=Trichinella murrelli TaxID=144512 RepID=A0A0V0TGA3_9BILA|nr:hypothetical protein T05_15651 [Trichinella murrelli]